MCSTLFSMTRREDDRIHSILLFHIIIRNPLSGADPTQTRQSQTSKILVSGRVTRHITRNNFCAPCHKQKSEKQIHRNPPEVFPFMVLPKKVSLHRRTLFHRTKLDVIKTGRKLFHRTKLDERHFRILTQYHRPSRIVRKHNLVQPQTLKNGYRS